MAVWFISYHPSRPPAPLSAASGLPNLSPGDPTSRSRGLLDPRFRVGRAARLSARPSAAPARACPAGGDPGPPWLGTASASRFLEGHSSLSPWGRGGVRRVFSEEGPPTPFRAPPRGCWRPFGFAGPSETPNRILICSRCRPHFPPRPRLAAWVSSASPGAARRALAPQRRPACVPARPARVSAVPVGVGPSRERPGAAPRDACWPRPGLGVTAALPSQGGPGIPQEDPPRGALLSPCLGPPSLRSGQASGRHVPEGHCPPLRGLPRPGLNINRPEL